MYLYVLGVINVDFKAPNQNCKYKVSLFVNPYITNSEDCKKYLFDKDNFEEIHTLEKTVCPRHDSESEEKEDEVVTTESSTCKVWLELVAFKLIKFY